MIPSFVIHHDSCKERDDIVNDIVNKTKALVFQSYLLADGKKGCRQSHIGVAKLAKQLYPDQSYFVFEDDCVLSEDWFDVIKKGQEADLTYLGYNDLCSHSIFGTHALYISPRARDIIIQHTENYVDSVPDRGAFDMILSLLCRTFSLSVYIPSYEDKDVYATQKKGLISQITGKPRI